MSKTRADLRGKTFQKNPSWRNEKWERACPKILPSPTKISRERLGRKGTCPEQYILLSLSEIGRSFFWPRILPCEKSRTWLICKNLASAVISQKTREANHIKRCNLEVSRVDWLGWSRRLLLYRGQETRELSWIGLQRKVTSVRRI